MKDQILLETTMISKTFGNRKVVDNLSLKIHEGDIYGFLGQNGSGKTTTIRMMMGLIFPDAGVVRIGGFDLKKDFKNAISQVGAIVENPTFYTYLSGYDNLMLMANLVPGLNKSRIHEVLEIVGLAEKAKDKVKTYSLGMRQRLGIANALLSNPRLIILDEPTNGLDPQGMKEIKEMIIQLASEKGITFFISSHLLNDVEQICTRVGIIQKGKLLAEGSVKELLHTENEVVEVYTPDIEKTVELLKTTSYIQSVEKSPHGLTVHIHKNCSAKLNMLLVSNHIQVNSIVPKTTSLEKLFFDITGEGGIKR